MTMKKAALLSALFLVFVLLSGCKANPAPTPTPTPKAPDVVTTASIVNTEAAFKNAISDNGTWIIAALKSMTFEEAISLEGTFVNGKKDAAGKDIIQRKIALYTQDANHNVTARFTLSAPKLNINSPNARIQSGTFVGDIYVTAANFELVDAKVTGNIYFASKTLMDSFKMDAQSSVSGIRKVI
jgi:hypothetical protein